MFESQCTDCLVVPAAETEEHELRALGHRGGTLIGRLPILALLSAACILLVGACGAKKATPSPLVSPEPPPPAYTPEPTRRPAPTTEVPTTIPHPLSTSTLALTRTPEPAVNPTQAREPTAVTRAGAPVLLNPAEGATVTSSFVELIWRWHRPLGPNEFFDVRVWREGQPSWGIAWEKETSHELDIFGLPSRLGEIGIEGTYYWAIAVILASDDVVLETVSLQSDVGMFTWRLPPLPPASPTPTECFGYGCPTLAEHTDIPAVAVTAVWLGLGLLVGAVLVLDVRKPS